MTEKQFSLIKDEVRMLLRNDKEYEYLSTYQYKHTDISALPAYIDPIADKEAYLDFLLDKFADAIPSGYITVPAKSFAKYLKATLMVAIGMDILADKDINENKTFKALTKKSSKNQVEVSFSNTHSGKNLVYVSLADICLLLYNPKKSGIACVVNCYVKFLLNDEYDYLDTPISVNVTTNADSAKYIVPFKELNNAKIQEVINMIK